MTNGVGVSSESVKAKVFAVTGRGSADFNMAVHMCAYGRCTAEQLQKVTQALIDKGKLADVRAKYDAMPDADFRARHGSVSRPLSDENAIKLMQFDYGVGIDCAGYVQQAFLDVHGGSRQAWAFHERIGYEDLSDLKGNPAFDRTTTPVNAVPGESTPKAPTTIWRAFTTPSARSASRVSAGTATPQTGPA